MGFDYINLTKSCSECRHFITLDGQKACFWGNKAKLLRDKTFLEECEYRNITSPREEKLRKQMNPTIYMLNSTAHVAVL